MGNVAAPFIGLLKREWLEHRAAFVWVPGAWLVIILLAGFSAVSINSAVEPSFSAQEQMELAEKLGEDVQEDLSFLEIVAAMALDVAGSTDAELQEKMKKLLDGVAIPFHLVFVLIAFFALLASLYDERKDQTVLFWKSMPVSDWQTVASKLVFVVWVAPLVTIAAIVLAQFFVISLSSIFVEDGMGGRIWSASAVWERPFGLLVRYFVLSLWALPFCGWVLLISASTSRLPFLWAIGIPWVAFVLERILIGSNFLGGVVVEHFKVLVASPSSGDDGIAGALALFGHTSFWVGILVGAAFLGGAVFFRGRNNEI